MPPETQSILQDAWQRNALCRIFVHFQKQFYDAQAFYAGGILLNGLRERKISTDFLLSVGQTRRLKHKDQKIVSQDLKNIPDNCQPNVALPRRPTIFKRPDAMFNFDGWVDGLSQTAINHFNNAQNPALIVSGVYSRHYLKGAIHALLNKVNNAQVIVASDATDNQTSPEEHKKILTEGAKHPEQIHIATTAQILGTIDLARHNLV